MEREIYKLDHACVGKNTRKGDVDSNESLREYVDKVVDMIMIFYVPDLDKNGESIKVFAKEILLMKEFVLYYLLGNTIANESEWFIFADKMILEGVVKNRKSITTHRNRMKIKGFVTSVSRGGVMPSNFLMKAARVGHVGISVKMDPSDFERVDFIANEKRLEA